MYRHCQVLTLRRGSSGSAGSDGVGHSRFSRYAVEGSTYRAWAICCSLGRKWTALWTCYVVLVCGYTWCWGFVSVLNAGTNCICCIYTSWTRFKGDTWVTVFLLLPDRNCLLCRTAYICFMPLRYWLQKRVCFTAVFSHVGQSRQMKLTKKGHNTAAKWKLLLRQARDTEETWKGNMIPRRNVCAFRRTFHGAQGEDLAGCFKGVDSQLV